MKKIFIVSAVVLIAITSASVVAYIVHDRKVKEEIRIAEEAKRRERESQERLERQRREQERVQLLKLEIWEKEASHKRSKIEKQVADDRGYMDRLHEISGWEFLSGAAQDEAESLIKILSSRYGDLAVIVDRKAGRIVGIEEAEKRFAERSKQVRISALKKQIDATKALADYQMKIALEKAKNGDH